MYVFIGFRLKFFSIFGGIGICFVKEFGVIGNSYEIEGLIDCD